jgi:hypothetical protein
MVAPAVLGRVLRLKTKAFDEAATIAVAAAAAAAVAAATVAAVGVRWWCRGVRLLPGPAAPVPSSRARFFFELFLTFDLHA